MSTMLLSVPNDMILLVTEKKFLTTFLFVPSCVVEENKLKIDVSIQREHSKISTIFCHSALEAHT
jgi:hypothetical protein